MTGRTVLSPLARADVDAIWTDTVERWGIDQAESYVRQIGHHIQLLADRPSIGRACPEIRTGYHKFPSGSHIVFLRLGEDCIEVVRILHAHGFQAAPVSLDEWSATEAACPTSPLLMPPREAC